MIIIILTLEIKKRISFFSFSISFRKYRRSNVESEFCCFCFSQKLSFDLKYLLNKSKIEKTEVRFLISVFFFQKNLDRTSYGLYFLRVKYPYLVTKLKKRVFRVIDDFSLSIVMQNAIINTNYPEIKF